MKTDCSWDHSLARWKRQQSRPSAGLLLAEHQYCTLAHWQVLMCTEGPLTAYDLEEHSHQKEVKQDWFKAGQNLYFTRELEELWSQGVQPPPAQHAPEPVPSKGVTTLKYLEVRGILCSSALAPPLLFHLHFLQEGKSGHHIRLAQKQWASTDEQYVKNYLPGLKNFRNSLQKIFSDFGEGMISTQLSVLTARGKKKSTNPLENRIKQKMWVIKNTENLPFFFLKNTTACNTHNNKHI